VKKLRRFAIAAVAAATVTIASLASAPTASAEMSCAQKETLAVAYWAYGVALYNIGADYQATYWWGRADQIMVGC
jgi:hypothetical protein